MEGGTVGVGRVRVGRTVGISSSLRRRRVRPSGRRRRRAPPYVVPSGRAPSPPSQCCLLVLVLALVALVLSPERAHLQLCESMKATLLLLYARRCEGARLCCTVVRVRLSVVVEGERGEGRGGCRGLLMGMAV